MLPELPDRDRRIAEQAIVVVRGKKDPSLRSG
jgi:hypothetical protein